MATVAEARRLAALHSLAILDTKPEERFDRITRLAAAVFGVPTSLVTLIDADREWNKSAVGLDVEQWPRSVSLCARAIESEEPLVIADLRSDPRFPDHALGGERPPLRFYAAQPVRAPGGDPVGTLCIADVRPRELDPQALGTLGDLAGMVEAELARTELEGAVSDRAQSEAGLRAIMESTSEGIITFDGAGVVRSANPAAERLFGSEPDRLAGTPVSELLAEISWSYAEEALRVNRARDGQTLIGRRALVRGRRRDGTEFPLEFAISTTSVAGAPTYVGVGQDVSGREAEAQELRERERRFRAVFEHAGVGIIISRGGVLLDVNAAFGEMLGRSVAELQGRAWAELTHPDDVAEDQRLAHELAGGVRDFYRREQRFLRRDASPVWVSVTATLQRSDEDDASLTIAVAEDISERREIERLKNEFVSVVGHELRTPLTSIRGSLGLLAGGVAGELPPEATQMVQLAVDNTDRLVRLVNDTLELERLDAGRMELHRRPAELADLTATALRAVAALGEAAGVSLLSTVSGIRLLADPDRVVQALVNLLGNAIKFSPRTGTVIVSAEPRGHLALISVSDEGPGIPAEKLDSIFERFTQVDSSDARVKGGTGLGLAITRAIVEHHGGRIWAESAAVGGATFRMTLPLLGGRAGIAVCERRAEARARMTELVERLGHPAIAAASAQEVRDAARREPVAAIVVAAGGALEDTLESLRSDRATSELPVVLVGGGSREGDTAGVSAWLDMSSKGTLVEALRRAVPAIRPHRVLVVEDDPDLGRLLVATLAGAGIDAELAATGREAMLAIERAPPELLVLDVGLPGGDGFAVADWLRDQGRLTGTPLLIYSGHEFTEDQRTRLQLGSTEFVTKAEVAPEDLQQRIADLLARITDSGEEQRINDSKEEQRTTDSEEEQRVTDSEEEQR
jgi:PAS domain S-box-containing protein